MIRIIGVSANCGMAANLGGPVHIAHRIFEVECPDLEAWLADGAKSDKFEQRSVQGVEVIKSTEETNPDANKKP